MKLWREHGETIFKSLFLGLLAIAVILLSPLEFLDGIYSSVDIDLYAFLDFLTIWPLCFLCLVVTIVCLIKHRPALKFSITWILLAILHTAQPPGIVPEKAGAFWLVHQIGPNEVVKEGQELIQKYKDSSDETHEYEIVNYPPAIKRLHPIYVQVYVDNLRLRKKAWAIGLDSS